MNRIALTKLPACALAVGLLAAPTTAGAIEAKGGHYAQSKNNVIIATFDVAGVKVRNFSHNDRCTNYPLEFPAFGFGFGFGFGNGDFSFTSNAVKDLNSQEWSVRITGKAISRTVVKGSMTYKKTKGNARCETTTKFRVRTGKVRR